MRLRQITIENFRGYRQPTTLRLDAFTSIVGRNDVGKSTLLEALDIFFNDILPDADDANINARGQPTRITCEFDQLPARLVLDERATTSLQDEHLINKSGRLELSKVFDLSASKIAAKAFARCLHPTVENGADLLSLTNAKLKARCRELRVALEQIDERVNAELRAAIWAHLGNLETRQTEVPLNDVDGKLLWGAIQRELPMFAVFKADRPSREDDSEVTDPMEFAIRTAIKAAEPRLDAIRDEIKGKVDEVARRTLEKLREMDATLADDLQTEFKTQPKYSGFKVTLSDHNGIPINKRGSGVRRLVLLNFFRAEAERRQQDVRSPGIIYAIEEPESSQHPSNQVMLVNALMQLADADNTQVIVTTHVPGVAALVPTESVRYVARDEAGHPCIITGDENILAKVADQLGVLPDKRVRVLFYVEGINDVSFMEIVSKLTGIIDLNTDPRVAFVVTGGGNLKHWVNKQYLSRLQLPEVHFYDRDEDHQYADAIAAVNARGLPYWGSLTEKREIENYLHSDAVADATGLAIAIDDDGDVPSALARALHEASPNARPWAEVTPEDQGKKCSRAKKRLCVDAASKMTIERLRERDANGQIEALLRRLAGLCEA